MKKQIKTSIIGASGYTGAELVRILYHHPYVEVISLIADSSAGQKIGAIYPHLNFLELPELIKLDKAQWEDIDVVFCALPHGTSQEVISNLPEHLKIIDLSADFRLHDPEDYNKWYGHAHIAPELQKEAIYGLTEIYRDEVKKTRLVANPGCYTTTSLLPLIPLVRENKISTEGIIIDAKSGITGAGRTAKTANLFAEVNEGVKPYSLGGVHRHTGEIDQELSIAAKKKVMVTFSPQVVPMNRGILANIYVHMRKGLKAGDLKETLREQYKNEPFINICKDNYVPNSRDVVGTNNAMINIFDDRIEGRAIIVSVTDNLVKGASGQAVQNMNLIFGFPETTGLQHICIFP